MIYNFNLGIGWASSGVEYAQIYRARMFRILVSMPSLYLQICFHLKIWNI